MMFLMLIHLRNPLSAVLLTTRPLVLAWSPSLLEVVTLIQTRRITNVTFLVTR